MKKLVLAGLLIAFVGVQSLVSASTDVYTAAVENSARSAKDKEVDSRRKPAQVLEFFQIKPGMDVLDVFAGGGYYSEILSNLVGPKGSVALYNNKPWDDYVSKAVTPRLAENRLPNVERIVMAPEAIATIAKRYDAAIFILGMHDLYYADEENNWPAIDKSAFMKGVFDLLKEGAVFGVIDANAIAGADNQAVGKKLHRVDPAAIIADVEAAGFKLEAKSDLLANPKDDKTTSVFLPENRYNTDRSVLRFRKPSS